VSGARPALWTVLLVTSLAAACPLLAVDFAGVTVADSVEVGGRELKLNGTGLLKKLVFKVYVVALYLPAPAHDDESVVGPDEPKSLVMHFLRAVSREALVGALERGFAANAGERAKRAESQIAKLLAVVKDMKGGERLTFVYEPGKGSTVTATDGTTVTLEGKDFADAFLLLYIGPKPPKEEMKRNLLGQL